jgi:integrase
MDGDLDFYLDGFGTWLKDRQRTDRTVADYERDIRRFLSEHLLLLGGKLDRPTILRAWRRFQRAMRGNHNKYSTLSRRKHAVRTYVRYLADSGKLARDFSNEIELPLRHLDQGTGGGRSLGPEAIEKLLAHLHELQPRAQLILVLLAGGLKLNEILSLKLNDDLRDRLIRVSRVGHFLIASSAAKILKAYIDQEGLESGFLFPGREVGSGRRTKPLSISGFRILVYESTRRIVGSALSPEDIRRLSPRLIRGAAHGDKGNS